MLHTPTHLNLNGRTLNLNHLRTLRKRISYTGDDPLGPPKLPRLWGLFSLSMGPTRLHRAKSNNCRKKKTPTDTRILRLPPENKIKPHAFAKKKTHIFACLCAFPTQVLNRPTDQYTQFDLLSAQISRSRRRRCVNAPRVRTRERESERVGAGAGRSAAGFAIYFAKHKRRRETCNQAGRLCVSFAFLRLLADFRSHSQSR